MRLCSVLMNPICLLTLLLTTTVCADALSERATEDGASDSKRKSSMIEHTVTFRLQHASGSAEEKAFLDAAAELASIPGVKDFHIRRQVSPKNPHAFGISMRFDSAKQYEAYNEHPQHVRFVEQRWINEVVDFQEADFQPLDCLAEQTNAR